MTTSIIAVSTSKGGVAKSTSVANLGAVFAQELGKKVLLIDSDPQASLSQWFGFTNYADHIASSGLYRPGDEPTLYNAIINEWPLEKAISHTSIPNLDIIFPGAELQEVPEKFSHSDFRTLLVAPLLDSAKKNEYDIIFFDTDGKASCLLTSILNTSDYFLMPATPDSAGLAGLYGQINRTETTMRRLNPSLTNLGVLITRYDKKNASHVQYAPAMRELGKTNNFPVLDTMIPESTAVAGATSAGHPMINYKPSLPISEAYRIAAKELLPELTGRRIGRVARPSTTNFKQKATELGVEIIDTDI